MSLHFHALELKSQCKILEFKFFDVDPWDRSILKFLWSYLVETHPKKDYTITNKAKIMDVSTLSIDNYGQILLTIALTLELILIVIGALFSSARGKGRVVVIGSTSMFDDTWLDKEDNFKLLEFLMSWLTKQSNVQVLILTIYQRCLYFPYCLTCLNP